MKKRFVSITLLLALTVSVFSGCGSTKAQKTTEESKSSETSSSQSVSSTQSDNAVSQASGTETSSDVTGALKGVTLKIGTSGTYAPFSYFDKDGTTLQGYDVDMLNELQKILGFTVDGGKLSDMDYGPLTTSISQDQLDVVAAALCATDTRKESMNFSDTYYDAGIVVIVPKDEKKITSFNDLKSGNYKVAVQTGTISYEYAAANLPEKCIQSFDSQALAYKAVEGGQADATIYDAPGSSYSIKTGEVNLKIVGDEFYQGQAPYAIAFSFDICKKYPDLVTDFNAAIKQLEENGTMDQLKKKWCE